MNMSLWRDTAVIALIPFGLYMAVLAYRYLTAGRLDNASVKYAMDHLPMGILFYGPNGIPLLVNETMQRLCRRMMKKGLTDGNAFHAFLFAKEADDTFRITGTGDDFLVFFEEEVWSFIRREVKTDRGQATQLIAYDAGGLYAREKELYRQVQLLHDTGESLKRYQEQVDELAANGAYLAAKERIHDSLGQVLIATRYFLTDPDARIQPQDLIASWKKTIDELTNAAGGEAESPEKESFLKPLEGAANALGAKLIITGRRPEEDIRLKRLMMSCARVCMINAVRHGAADEITIAVDEQSPDGRFTFRISNNGRVPEVFEEGGGLKSMRGNVEKEGGTVAYETAPRFTAVISVPVEKS